MRDFLKAYLYSYYDIPIYNFEEKKAVDLSDSDSVETLTVYHECGHAVVAELLFPESVSLVTYYNRSDEEGGITKCCHKHELKTFKSLEKNIIISLAGMAAIDKKFGIRDIGNNFDMAQAFYTLSDAISSNCTSGFTLFHQSRSDSDELNNRKEIVIAAEIERYYFKAKEIISRNYEFFEKLATELAEKKILCCDDVRRIKGECGVVAVNI